MLGKLIERLSGRAGRRKTAALQLTSEATDLFGAGDLPAALSKITEAVACQSDCALALQMQGTILSALGQSERALASFYAALEVDRKSASLHLDFGNASRMAGDLESAEVRYRQALELEPGFELAWKSLGTLLLDMQRPVEAAAVFSRALEITPEDHESLKNLGKAAFRTYDFELTCKLFRPLYCKKLLDVEACYFLGAALLFTGNVDEAGNVLEETIARAPQEAALIQMLSYKHLLSGDWLDGFRLYERRHNAMRSNPEHPGLKTWIDFIDTALAGVPAWTDGGCAGKRLLIWAEQGLGDTIMMLRLLPVLRKEWGAAAITFLCTSSLKALQDGCESAHFIAATASWKAQPGEFDGHCSIMSLPYLMRIAPDSIPGAVPYIHVPAAMRQHWRDTVQILPGLRVGLVWAGNPGLLLDSLRSIPLDKLKPLLLCAGASFVSLQKDDAAREELKTSGMLISDWMDQCGNFMETAALIDNLDLVISVDTAVVHLAGALGKPVWLLNRFESDWRWMRGREDSLWYPSVRIFSQTESRKWDLVISKAAAALNELSAARG